MSRGADAFRRLRAAYAEFRDTVAQQRQACAAGDAEALLATAIEGDWLSARIAELHAASSASTSRTDPEELLERAACAAEAAALAKELEQLATEVSTRRDATAVELAGLPTGTVPGGYRVPAPMLLDARG